MTVLEDLSRQHPSQVAGWSKLPRTTTKLRNGKIQSVYQHESTRGTPVFNVFEAFWSSSFSVLTIENVLASMITEEREKSKRESKAADEAKTSVAQWIHDGITIERQQYVHYLIDIYVV